jgi:pimeloyl-ACP methyl ester carboxylesterase
MLKTLEKNQVQLQIDSITLNGKFNMPENALGVVIFTHGAGSGWQSPRNNYVAKYLEARGIGSLVAGLLTEEEDRIYENRFDIDLLTQRLQAATNWVLLKTRNSKLPIGYFGASTGAAAAIKAAVAFDSNVKALVSRGGRPDLAWYELPLVKVPTLLIVGENDPEVLELNKQAFFRLKTTKQLEIIPKAGHLFEEPGTLRQAATLTGDWFEQYLCSDVRY